jgi:NAD(P)-dependent dehydrogenase (short-subunit alcohol dehydrogenase family)
LETLRMRIFVAGATGVIGKRAVPLMIAAGHEVEAIGRTAEKRAQLEELGAVAVAVDVFDLAALRRAVADHEAVINLATHIPAGWTMFCRGLGRKTIGSVAKVRPTLSGRRLRREHSGLSRSHLRPLIPIVAIAGLTKAFRLNPSPIAGR